MYIPDVPLADEDTGVVNRLGQTKLEHLSLQTPLQEILDPQSKHIVEPGLGLVQYTDTDQTADKGVTLEQTTGVLLIKGKKLTGSTTDVGQAVSDPPL